MIALLIDPETGRVRAVEHVGGLESVLQLLHVERIDAFRIDRRAAIYIDDEGLLAAPPLLGFQVELDGEWSHFLAGRGLVVGTTRDGDDAPAPFTVAEFAPRVRFGMLLPRR